jgi:hypothetical protein
MSNIAPSAASRLLSQRYLGRDFVEMPLHGLGIASGQDEAGADTTPRPIIYTVLFYMARKVGGGVRRVLIR